MTALTPDRRALAEAHLWVAEEVAGERRFRTFARSGLGDDIRQAAALGLVRAAARHKVGRAFEHYARIRCQGEVLDLLRREGKYFARRDRLPPDFDLAAPAPRPAAGLTTAEAIRAFQAAGPRGALILRLRLVEGLTLAAVGGRLGVSPGRVCQLQQVAEAEVRAVLREGD